MDRGESTCLTESRCATEDRNHAQPGVSCLIWPHGNKGKFETYTCVCSCSVTSCTRQEFASIQSLASKTCHLSEPLSIQLSFSAGQMDRGKPFRFRCPRMQPNLHLMIRRAAHLAPPAKAGRGVNGLSQRSVPYSMFLVHQWHPDVACLRFRLNPKGAKVQTKVGTWTELPMPSFCS